MPNLLPKGSYHLQPGVHIAPLDQGGVVLQQNPLRALRLNPRAFQLLSDARHGFSLPAAPTDSNGSGAAVLLPFLDTMCQAGILKWTPPPERFEPMVSIIVPVYNRAQDIGACLEALLALDYPRAQREIIVVDDASCDQTVAVVRRYDVKLMVMPRNAGPAAARNRALQAARGSIIAFTDSDCIVDAAWLRELLPYFHDPRTALVGGYVDAYYRRSWLDRYEITHSALNMGTKKVVGSSPQAAFYVPTCNMLVRKKALERVDGFDPRLRLGEDVDLCWRLAAHNYRQIYVPSGKVNHKHRCLFWPTFKRRFDYGTSEAMLYHRYPQVTKRFPWQTGGLMLIAAGVAGLFSLSPWTIPAAAALVALEAATKQRALARQFGLALPWGEVLKATLRSHGLLAFYLLYYLLRYHLLPLLVLAALFPQMALPLLGLLLYPTLVEYVIKKPRIGPAPFWLFFWVEQAFYQAGAFWGCIVQHNFRLYRIAFVKAGFLPQTSNSIAQRIASWLRRSTEASRYGH